MTFFCLVSKEAWSFMWVTSMFRFLSVFPCGSAWYECTGGNCARSAEEQEARRIAIILAVEFFMG
jgi:hypothetical protein